ncbi:DUF4405 domain-containing protein [candidate division KSB1 bacterium]
MADRKKRFHTRGFISLVSFWTFILLAVSGVFLYITPAGRIANWSDWTMLNLTKEGWAGFHIIISVLFLLMVVLHIYLNWKPLLNYLRSRAKASFSLKKELLFSLVVTVLFTLGAVTQSQPLWQLMNWNEDIKGYWELTYTNPPVPHAEDMTLAELSEIIKTDRKELVDSLVKNDIEIPSDDSKLKDIAEHNGLKPNEVYAFFGKGDPVSVSSTEHTPGIGGGMGRMTLEQYAESKNLDIDAVTALLKKSNISATGEETLKDIAEKHDMMLYDLVKLLGPNN